MVGLTPRLQQVLALVRMIAKSDSVTWIQGETGAGKEVIASAIHQSSRRCCRWWRSRPAACPRRTVSIPWHR